MSELDLLKAQIHNLNNRVALLEDTLSTIINFQCQKLQRYTNMEGDMYHQLLEINLGAANQIDVEMLQAEQKFKESNQ